MQPIYKEIAPDVERALGEVMLAECKGRNVPAWIVASRADFAQSTVKAFTRGKRQPKLATFIALAWALHMEPRDLFDKLLTTMRLPPGKRPVLHTFPK